MAVTITAAQLADRIQGAAAESTDRAAELLVVATAMVQQYAPAAPDVLQNEATIRLAGYLAQSDFGPIVKETIGPRAVDYVVNHAPAFRNSGAAMLLSRWRVRRAGAIG